MSIKNFPRTAYIIFAITIILVIVAKSFAVNYFIQLEKQDAKIINVSGRQRMLSQRITKQVFYQLVADKTGIASYENKSLSKNIEDFKKAHFYLKGSNKKYLKDQSIDSLLLDAEPYMDIIATEASLIDRSGDYESFQAAASQISIAEQQYLEKMETITRMFQEAAELKNDAAMQVSYFLAVISLIIILAEFFLVIIPTFRTLKKNNRILSQKNKQLSDFAQITAHNLRAPIGNLIFLSNFYKEAEDPAEKQELFGKVETVVGHLDETIRILVDSLRIQNQLNLTYIHIDFEKVLSATEDILAGEIMETGAIITSDFSEAPFIDYHRVYMDSIFLNLIGNAMKYKAEDRAPKIHVKTKTIADGIQLLVSDNGLGIDLERQGKKVFGLHQTFHRHEDAKGIGLFMTKNQIESLGGTIEVESEPNKGSTFIVTFKTES